MKRHAISALSALVVGSALTLLVPATPASAGAPVQITGRASALAGAAEPAVKGESYDAVVSGQGRYVAFTSTARLIPADVDLRSDVYVKDLLTDSLERINVTVDGAPADSGARPGAISPDGRYVVFMSYASNLVPGDGNGVSDVFVRDRKTKTTELVSRNSAEQVSNGESPSQHDDVVDISADGRYVSFSSTATNLGPDADAIGDIFVRDRSAGTTALISVNDAGTSTDDRSFSPTMSADGRFVAFQSDATNLVAGDTNGSGDIFVRDRQGPSTTRVSIHDNEGQSPTGAGRPSIDDSGTKVVFASTSKLNAIDPNSTYDVYVRNRTANTTTVASVGKNGWAAGDSVDPAISGDGMTVAFQSDSAAVDGIGNATKHLFTRWNTTTRRVSVNTAGLIVNGDSRNPSMSADGKVIGFDSVSTKLAAGDTNGMSDVFFRRWMSVGPFADTTGFVQRQLFDFTGGHTPAKVDPAKAAIESGASPEHWVRSLANAPSFAGKRPQVIRLYVAYFKRMPDLNGLNYWLGRLAAGMTLDQVSAKFATSSEFKTKYGNTTNSQFVKLVYGNVFDRQPDASGLAYWVAKLDQGMSWGTVLTNFSESSEGKRHFDPYVQVTLLGIGMIHKLPTGSLLDQMLAAATSDSPEAAAKVMLDSAEYLDAVN